MGEKWSGYLNIRSLRGEKPVCSTPTIYRQLMLATEKEVHDVLLLPKYVVVNEKEIFPSEVQTFIRRILLL